jgi:hypothetical protein
MTDRDLTRAEVEALTDGTTEGPWRVLVDESAAQVKGFPCIEADEYTIVGLEGMYGDIKVDYANARLIAAAPTLARQLLRCMDDRDSAIRGRDDWRDDYKALAAAIVGDTGLSAMTVATQARMYRPRAEAAQAENARLREALERIADTDPDEGTSWFHNVARAELQTAPTVTAGWPTEEGEGSIIVGNVKGDSHD